MDGSDDEFSLNPMKPYEFLEVSPEDSMETIKEKFNKLILKYHPDKYKTKNKETSEILEEYCRKLIRSYKIIKRDKSNLNDYFDLKKQVKDLPSIPTSYSKKEEFIDTTTRFKTVDDYLSFNVPKPPKNNKILSARDFNEHFKKNKTQETSKALVLRTSDGFTGYNVDQFSFFAKNAEGKDLLYQQPLWERKF